MLYRLFAYIMLLCLCTVSLPTWAKISDAEAVNMSGLQRMLSQRIAKSYLMIGQRVKLKEALQQRDSSVALFEKNLNTLKEYAPNADISDNLKKVESIWLGYKKRVLVSPSRDEALTVIRQSDEILKLSEVVVKQIQDYSNVSAARLVNISGRQRMLSQRIGKLYLTKSWGLSYDSLAQDLTIAINDYENALQELSSSQLNTPEIEDGLIQVKRIWTFSKAGFALSGESLYVPTTIANTTENLLTHMQRITKLYEVQIQMADNNKTKSNTKS